MLVDSPSRGFSEFAAPSRIILELLQEITTTATNTPEMKESIRVLITEGLFYIFDSLK